MATVAKSIQRSLARSYSTFKLKRIVPPAKGDIKTPAEFLHKIGKGVAEHAEKFPMKAAGIPVARRRYILKGVELFRLGVPAEQIPKLVAKHKKTI